MACDLFASNLLIATNLDTLTLQVKAVKLRPGINTHNGCGIDGELLRVKGQVLCSLLPEQCRLIGRPARDRL